MTGDSSPRGVTEQFLARFTRAGMPTFGPLPEAGVGIGYAALAALLLRADGRALAGVILVFMAWRGGMAALVAAGTSVPTWQRAAVAVLNVAAEGIVIVAAAFWARGHQDRPGPLAVGMLAFAGVLLLSYARLRIRASAGKELADGPHGVASREVRLLVLAAGVLARQPYWALVAVAALTHLSVLGHLVHLRATLRG